MVSEDTYTRFIAFLDQHNAQQGTYISFDSADIAEKLVGSVVGTI